MLALVLQVSPHEITEAEELVALLTDLESVSRKDCEFFLFVRRDVEQSDRRRIGDRIATKFAKNKVIECWDFATGWPHGSNTMWCSLIRQLFHMRRMDEVASDGFLSFETDCIPIKTNWIELLSKVWNEAKADGKEAIGHFHPDSKNPTHLNGNAIFVINFWERHQELLGSHGMEPWDVAFARTILPLAMDTPCINQWYRLQEFNLGYWNEIAKTPCVFFHGVKHPDGRRIARQQLLGPWPTDHQPRQEIEMPTSAKRSKASKAKSVRSTAK